MATLYSGLGGPTGYGEQVFSSFTGSEDGSVFVDITSVFPSGIDFFGTIYTGFYVNENGTISFDSPYSTWNTPSLAGEPEALIAVFFADVSLPNNASGEIYWDLDPVTGTITVTWVDVASYFSEPGLNTFQVQIKDLGSGNYSIEYIYGDIQWVGDPGDVADAGITDGASEDHILDGSGDAGTVINYETHDFGSGDPPGTHTFIMVNGFPAALNGLVEGTNNDDLIDASYLGDPDGDVVDGGDGSGAGGDEDDIRAGGGNDTILAGDEADTVYGGSGSDSIFGNAGQDTIYGDSDPSETIASISINDSNFADTTNGYTVTAQNIVGGVLTAPSVANIATYSGGGFGASGTISDSDSGVQEQIGYDLASGQSEVVIVAFDTDVTEASFSFDVLWTSSFAEVGHWAIYNDGVLVAESDFSEGVVGSGSGTIDLSGYGSFDEIRFTALPQTDGTDGSDYVITDVTFTPSTTYDDTIAGGLGADLIYGEQGDDSILGGASQDTIYGGEGDDTISGDGGNDLIYGDNGPGVAATDLTLHWLDEGADGTDISSGFSQDTGGIIASVTYTDDGNGNAFEVSTDTQYVATGESFDSGSSGFFGGGSVTGDTSTLRVDFAATTASGFSDEVTDVSFRINDLDQSGWEDLITIRAFDANGDPLQVTIVYQGTTTTGIAPSEDGDGSTSASDESGSALITIEGPVAYFEVDYDQLGTAGQALWITDVHFTSVPISGDDSIDGGLGADTIFGEGGHDTINAAEGDVVSGGDGDDVFNIVDLGEAGASTITVTGGETGETVGDTLNFGGLTTLGDITYTNTDDNAGGLSGSAILADGTVVNFSEIETVIVCFVSGTRLLTPNGYRSIDLLGKGDLVMTADDGPQPVRWIGRQSVMGVGELAPIRFRGGVLGAKRDLLVSPQHRMLLTGPQMELDFGHREVFAPAKALIDGCQVVRETQKEVTYIHLLFDRHQIVFAEGVAAESFFPADQSLDALDVHARVRLFEEQPELRANMHSYGPTARATLRNGESLHLSVTCAA